MLPFARSRRQRKHLLVHTLCLVCYHGSSSPSIPKNRPLSSGLSLSISDLIDLTDDLTLSVALGPPMSVRTQPGCKTTQVMPG